MSSCRMNLLAFVALRLSALITIITNISLIQNLISADDTNHQSATLIPHGKVHACLEDSIVFICQISPASIETVALIQWRIQFDSLSIPDVSEVFRQPYHVGTILRDSIHDYDNNEIEFVFNLTLVSSNALESTLTMDVHQLFNGAYVQCGENHASFASTVLYILEGAASITSLNQTFTISDSSESAGPAMILYWNIESDSFANIYYIAISPPTESFSIMSTSNTTIEVPILFNQEYIVSVLSSNCAGNSTSATISATFTHCAPPMIGPNVSIENYSVRDGIEGYQITYFCEYGFVPSSMLKAVCTFGGIWKPDPSRLVCTVDCGRPELRDNIVLDSLTNSSTTLGSIVRYYCVHDPGQDLRSSSATTMSSVCSISGRWIPNPMKYSCTISPNNSEGTLFIIIMIVLGTVCVILTVVGIVGGVLIHKFFPQIQKKIIQFIRKSKSMTYTSESRDDTVQNSTEIQLEVNDAYEQIDNLTV